LGNETRKAGPKREEEQLGMQEEKNRKAAGKSEKEKVVRGVGGWTAAAGLQNAPEPPEEVVACHELHLHSRGGGAESLALGRSSPKPLDPKARVVWKARFSWLRA
jgi:hypothetical protein